MGADDGQDPVLFRGAGEPLPADRPAGRGPPPPPGGRAGNPGGRRGGGSDPRGSSGRPRSSARPARAGGAPRRPGRARSPGASTTRRGQRRQGVEMGLGRRRLGEQDVRGQLDQRLARVHGGERALRPAGDPREDEEPGRDLAGERRAIRLLGAQPAFAPPLPPGLRAGERRARERSGGLVGQIDLVREGEEAEPRTRERGPAGTGCRRPGRRSRRGPGRASGSSCRRRSRRRGPRPSPSSRRPAAWSAQRSRRLSISTRGRVNRGWERSQRSSPEPCRAHRRARPRAGSQTARRSGPRLDPDAVGGVVIEDLAGRRLVDRPPPLRPSRPSAASGPTPISKTRSGSPASPGSQPLEPAVERRGGLLPAGDGEAEAWSS